MLARIAAGGYGDNGWPAVLGLLVLMAGPAMGQARPGARELVERPETLIGQPVQLARMRCYDPGAGDLVCQQRVGNRLLRVTGDFDPFGPVAVIQALVAQCRDATSLGNPACDMVVAGTVESAAATREAAPPGMVDVTAVRLGGMRIRRP
ncbi:hypothetical protein BN1110_00885 [bacterium YEK0313]|nr:hypothetical protein BN1110_00885 [bacterium YEK0313]